MDQQKDYIELYENEELIEIREARMDDLDTIVKFNYNLAKETEGKELDMDVLTKGVKALLLDERKGKYHVYTVFDKVVAQIMYTYEWSDWRNGNFLWIQSVYVDKEYRRKGIFNYLFNYIKNICDKDENIVGMRLYVEKENINAKATYESLNMYECDYNMYEYEVIHS